MTTDVTVKSLAAEIQTPVDRWYSSLLMQGSTSPSRTLLPSKKKKLCWRT